MRNASLRMREISVSEAQRYDKIEYTELFHTVPRLELAIELQFESTLPIPEPRLELAIEVSLKAKFLSEFTFGLVKT